MRVSDDQLPRILEQAKTIAVVGASDEPTKHAHDIPRYLAGQGYRVIPVNPNRETIMGMPAFDSLADIGEPIDIVNVFRPKEEAPALARQAADAGAKVLWLQAGIASAEAEEIATERGLEIVMNRCIEVEHKRALYK